MCVDVPGYKIINLYKLPRSRRTPTAIPAFLHLSLYVGDFNCQHVNWGYSKTFPDGESLDSWATANNLQLLYNPKGAASFSSHRWNIGANPDLAFASVGQDNQLPNTRVLGRFRRSQPRPFLITPPRLKVPAYSDLVKRWYFRKADWKRFCPLTGESVEDLKIWIVVIPKPEKPLEDPKSYCPISVVCVPFRILERLIYARVQPIVDPLLPQEQAGFDRRSGYHADEEHRG